MKFWKDLALTLIGAIVGVFVWSKTKKPDIVTDTYIEEQEQRVGKIKTRGANNNQEVKGTQGVIIEKTKKEKRQEKKSNRKLKRKK